MLGLIIEIMYEYFLRFISEFVLFNKLSPLNQFICKLIISRIFSLHGLFPPEIPLFICLSQCHLRITFNFY